MAENFANAYQTTLAADLTASAATLTVASATGAPAPQFRLLIDAEIVLVTAAAGVTYTVTRGVEGTVAANHTASAQVSHVVTAGALDQLRADAPHVIQDEGVALTARAALNLVGEHVAATDDATGNRTNVTVAVPDATTTAHGLLLAADKSKIDGIAAGAQVNVLEGVDATAPVTVSAIAAKRQTVGIVAATTAVSGSMSAADKTKLDTYPATPGLDGHTIQDEGVALAQRAGLNFVGPALTVTDDSAGNRSVVTLPTATGTVEGSLSAADKSKLDGVAAGAQVNVLEGITGTAPIVAGAIAGKSQAVSISPASGSAAGSMSPADKTKLDGYPALPALVALARTVVPAGGVASITFASIPAGYRDLQVRLTGRSTAAAQAYAGVSIQFNGDTAANYDSERVDIQGASVALSESLATATPFLGIIAAGTAVAGGMGAILAEIPDYGGAWRKMALGQSSIKQADAAGGLWQSNITVGWRSTAAITSILLAPSSGLFAENTVATLYGVRDA